MAIQSHNDGFNGNLNVDYALTIDQTLRFGLGYNTFKNRNQGIGGWDREERAYTRENHNGQFTVQQIGPLGRRAFLRTRVRYSWTDSASAAAIEAADRARPRCVHGGRRAGRRRPALEDADARLRFRLRARQPYLARRHADRRRGLALGRSHQLSRHLHVREPRRLRRRPAAQLHPAHRRPEHRLHLLPGRALRAGRLSHPAQPDAERRRALRSAEPRRRFRQRDAAPRRHLGARHRRHDDAARELGHLHRLAAERHLRADAACRRRTAEGDRSRQSAVSNHL